MAVVNNRPTQNFLALRLFHKVFPSYYWDLHSCFHFGIRNAVYFSIQLKKQPTDVWRCTTHQDNTISSEQKGCSLVVKECNLNVLEAPNRMYKIQTFASNLASSYDILMFNTSNSLNVLKYSLGTGHLACDRQTERKRWWWRGKWATKRRRRNHSIWGHAAN